LPGLGKIGVRYLDQKIGSQNQRNHRNRLCKGEIMSDAKQKNDDAATAMSLGEAVSPYQADVWRRLTPRERLRRSWRMRSRLPDLKAVHDRKLFPKP
jgi:hypothetical protein